MEDRLRSLYPRIPRNVRIITLARPGDLRIILETVGDREPSEALLLGIENKILKRLGEHIYSRGPDLEEIVGRMLLDRGKTVACAESCTGGLISHRLTNIPGSSGYFLKATVAYNDTVKTRDLGVSKTLLTKNGAVSEPVAEAMARGILKFSEADFGLAVTGIAGPGGGSPLKTHRPRLHGSGIEIWSSNPRPGGKKIFSLAIANSSNSNLRRKLWTCCEGNSNPNPVRPARPWRKPFESFHSHRIEP